jgi:hypothetical protein
LRYFLGFWSVKPTLHIYPIMQYYCGHLWRCQSKPTLTTRRKTREGLFLKPLPPITQTIYLATTIAAEASTAITYLIIAKETV